MRAQRVSYPGLNAPVDLALKLAQNFYLPDFRKQAIEQKVRFREFTSFAHSELRHFRSDIVEVFCVSFQI